MVDNIADQPSVREKFWFGEVLTGSEHDELGRDGGVPLIYSDNNESHYSEDKDRWLNLYSALISLP